MTGKDRQSWPLERKIEYLEVMLIEYPPEGWGWPEGWWWLCAGSAGMSFEEARPLWEAWAAEHPELTDEGRATRAP